MSIFNFFRKNHTKNDPYWDFDQSKHFRPKLNTGEFFRLSGFDFGWFVLEPISEYIQNKKGELIRGNTLSYGQKALYYWWYVDAQVNNGGFIQFYYNDHARYIPTIIKSLKHVGDNQMAELVNRSYDLYLNKNKKIKDARKDGLQGFSNLYKEINDFDELDDIYYNINEKTMKIIENFIRSNPNEICFDENGKEFDLNFTGDIKTFYHSKNIKEIIPIENGVISEKFRGFYETGKPKDEVDYLNGEQTGIRTEYYENGNKKFSITRSENPEGKLHSYYYENGNLKSTEIYINKNDRDGKWLRYYSNGQIKSETEFINKEFFVQNCWKEDGTQILKDGTGLYIHENNYWEGFTQKCEQQYLNYKRHGSQYTYNNNVLSLYQEMKDGKCHGLTKSYDDDGNLKEEIVYENGIKISQKSFDIE